MSVDIGWDTPPVARPRAHRHALRTAVLMLLMLLVAAVMLYPLWFMIDTSFQSEAQFLRGGGHSFSSWVALNGQLPWRAELLNSTIIAGGAILLILLVSTTMGFAVAKLRYRFGVLVFLGIVSAMLIPMQSIIIPAYVDLARVHLLNSYFGAILMYAALGTPFGTFLMTAYYRSLPDEIIEAGVVDGLSYLKAFIRIGLPLSAPALGTISVLQFIQIWDDLLVGLLLLQNPAQRPITVGLGALAAGHSTDVPVLMAGSIVSALPAVVVFVVFQRFLVSGLTAGIGK